MRLTFVRDAYRKYRPNLPGVILVSVIHCVPIYAFTWYFSVIDDLSARISISLLVGMLPVEELLSEPRPWKKRGEQYLIAAFFVLSLLLAASDEFNWPGLAINVVCFNAHALLRMASLEADARERVAANGAGASGRLDDGLLDCCTGR